LFDRNNQALVVFGYLTRLNTAPSPGAPICPALAFIGAGLF
jgi:hypothetical protein